jgi:hypothetical protein
MELARDLALQMQAEGKGLVLNQVKKHPFPQSCQVSGGRIAHLIGNLARFHPASTLPRLILPVGQPLAACIAISTSRMHTNKQTNKHSNKQTFKQTKKHSNKQTFKQTNIQTNKETFKHSNKTTPKKTLTHTHTHTHTHESPSGFSLTHHMRPVWESRQSRRTLHDDWARDLGRYSRPSDAFRVINGDHGNHHGYFQVSERAV